MNYNYVKSTLTKLSHWLWFGLLLSLLPIAFNIWMLLSKNQLQYIETFEKAISHGELLLICMSTIGVALGELIVKETDWKIAKIQIAGFTVLLALFTVFSFSQASRNVVVSSYVFETSIYTFCAAVLVSISSLILPERKKENG